MSNTQPKPIDVDTVRKWTDAGDAVLVDIREADEYAREHIPGAHSAPLSSFDGFRPPPGKTRIAVFHCQSGNRTQQASEKIAASGYGEVFLMEGGMQEWKRGGHAVNVNRKAPISIMRQVQIIAGSLALLGGLFGLYVDPNFVWLSAFVGAGLLFAGLTNTCAVASILAMMPWNRAPGEPAKVGSTTT